MSEVELTRAERRAKRRAERKVAEAAAEDAVAEREKMRREGGLAWQPGTGPEAILRRVVTYSYKGVPHVEYRQVHKAVKSTSVPIRKGSEPSR